MVSTTVTRGLRALGWVAIAAGTLVVLYLVYALVFTNVATRRGQAALAEDWPGDVRAVPGEHGVSPAAAPTAAAAPAPDGPVTAGPEPARPAPAAPAGPAPASVEAGEALAVLQFARPGSAQPIVREDPLYVVEGVGVEHLRLGPGHYPDTSLPGQAGNFAVAGHRTTYDAPFSDLDQLVPGDEVWVTDRAGERYTYRVVAQRIVDPDDAGVLAADPLGTGRPLLTLTTCHPRFSNAERLIVFAELLA